MLVVFTAVLCTLTMILAAFPLASCTVILAVPGVVPAAIVQVPFFFPATLTTFVSLDFQDFTESPFAISVTFTAVVFCLICREMEETLSFRTFVSFLPTVRVSVFLQIVQLRCCLAAANTVALEVVFHALQMWPVAAIVVWAFSTFPQVAQWLPSVFPAVSQVAFTPASVTAVWPFAGIVSCAFSTFPQVMQWLPSVFPVASQVAPTPASVTAVWSFAGIVSCAFSTFPQVVQWLPSVFPAVSQVASTAASATSA